MPNCGSVSRRPIRLSHSAPECGLPPLSRRAWDGGRPLGRARPVQRGLFPAPSAVLRPDPRGRLRGSGDVVWRGSDRGQWRRRGRGRLARLPRPRSSTATGTCPCVRPSPATWTAMESTTSPSPAVGRPTARCGSSRGGWGSEPSSPKAIPKERHDLIQVIRVAIGDPQRGDNRG